MSGPAFRYKNTGARAKRQRDVRDRIEALRHAVANARIADEDDAVENLIADLDKNEIAYLIVKAFQRPRPGRPADLSDRAYYKRKIKIKLKQRQHERGVEQKRSRLAPETSIALAEQLIAEIKVSHPQTKAMEFKAEEFVRTTKAIKQIVHAKSRPI